MKIETASKHQPLGARSLGEGRWAISHKLALAVFALGILVLCPMVLAVSPAPDGAYPGGNTAEGQQALLSLSIGTYNTSVGFLSLRNVTAGNLNTGVGAGTLLLNIADSNTAIGAGTLLSNTTGADNTANGAFALFHNVDGEDNTADGVQALFNNTSGSDNTATGVQALLSNTTGQSNVAYGDATLLQNITGSNNTAMGYQALLNTTGSNNIGLGVGAGYNLTTGESNIDIDNFGVSGESNTIRIGNTNHTRTFIAGISGATIASGAGVVVDGNGQLGVALSSRRFKRQIKPMDQTSESILTLKPVTFYYKSDTTDTLQFGLVAEEVEKVNPNLVVRDREGKPYTVRYDAVNAMLLNEFLKEHKTVQGQSDTIAALRKEIASLTATVKDQAEQIQKVSAQIEVNQQHPVLVRNHHSNKR
jgi:trimeric autotransporter adhesin